MIVIAGCRAGGVTCLTTGKRLYALLALESRGTIGGDVGSVGSCLRSAPALASECSVLFAERGVGVGGTPKSKRSDDLSILGVGGRSGLRIVGEGSLM